MQQAHAEAETTAETPAATMEVKREKVFIPPGMTPTEISKKYGINPSTATGAKKTDFS